MGSDIATGPTPAYVQPTKTAESSTRSGRCTRKDVELRGAESVPGALTDEMLAWALLAMLGGRVEPRVEEARLELLELRERRPGAGCCGSAACFGVGVCMRVGARGDSGTCTCSAAGASTPPSPPPPSPPPPSSTMSMRDMVPPPRLTTDPRLASSEEGESGNAPALLACPTWGVLGESGSDLSCFSKAAISSCEGRGGLR